MPGTRPGMTGGGIRTMTRSILQELAGLVERAEGNAGFGESFGRAFFAVDHGEHQHDLAAGLAHRFGGLPRRAPCRGDVLDDHDTLAGQGLAFGEAFYRKAGAMLLRLLANEEG